MLLVDYSSSEEEEEEQPPPPQPRPGVQEDGGAAASGPRVKAQRLPVPESVMGMFKQLEEHVDDSSRHDGRIRSFPHQRGNWSTLVYLEYYPEEEFLELIDLLLTHLQTHGLPMTKITEFHISLSHTVVLRHHWINIFAESLKERMTFFDRFYCLSDKVKIYSNQEKTRTFLGLEVSAGSNYLLELVKEVDKSLEEFSLETYYKNPSFHISVAWCLGDATTELEKHQQELQNVVNRFENGARILQMYADQVRCRTGNKIFSFPLR
ncbi:U6 snRNA phosphodiesterase 1 [Pristis pectinata]|uniref:U6 snRNA phosphodiesterase 1 n=1 Tax=Pristis pectinata TaxID=685728 RepID=UPI00223E62FA|nr:U6 snRNA phosphodiesterase 1 [Pristis pectinata]